MITSGRELSIDAFRGLAIIGMVLSGTIVHSNNLPGWMYHAQVGPPDFNFHPEVSGITWVDLVFPFFLFTMGLALPFALNTIIDRHDYNYKYLVRKLIFRAFNLFLFAIMIPHLSPFGLPTTMGGFRWLFSLLGFVAFMLTFTKFPNNFRWQNIANIIGYLTLFTLVLIRYLVLELPFSIHKNDIIILVLANMALIASGIWLFTRKNWWIRIAVLVLFLSIWLTSNIAGSISGILFQFTPLKFIGNHIPSFHECLLQYGINTFDTIFYSMYFMKYLFIVIPGTIIGDLMYDLFKSNCPVATSPVKYWKTIFAIILFGFTVITITGLYIRETQITVLITLNLMVIVHIILKKGIIEIPKKAHLWLQWSFFWLILGLLFEPYEGGIKKDPSTLSYFFVTSGLAGLTLFSLKLAFSNIKFQSIFNFLPTVGQNPMVGYVAVSFLVLPIIGLLGLMDEFESFSHLNGFTNSLRGLILSTIMIMITILSVKFKLFWKT